MSDEKKLKERDQIKKEYQWNIEDMYQNEQEWEEDFEQVRAMADEYGKYAGHLGENGSTLLGAYTERDRIWMKLERVFVYARMRLDEDNRIAAHQAMSRRAESLMSEVSAKMSFFTPELLELPEETILGFVNNTPGLEIYKHAVKSLLKQKAHILSKQEELLLAQFSEVSGAAKNIFAMINNADIKFGEVMDDEGDSVELTQGNYIGFLESHNREVRRNAYNAMYTAYEKQKNTLATTYNYNTKKNIMFSRIRKYDSPLQSALSGDDIPLTVYDNLIKAVNNRLDVQHKYVEVRRKMLGLDKVAMYDMYTPLVEMPKRIVPYEEALDIMRKGLMPLGEQYLADMNRGIDAGWIDVYENAGKTSGAYSFGSYDSMPYMLMNYTNKLKDVFTVVHEMGHSMNSYYTRKNQPYVYGGHSIFTAEVASTVNECLLIQDLLKDSTDPKERLYLLNLYIEEFRTTMIRQTMFAEFELLTHNAVAEGKVLTPEWLCREYGQLNQKYFGPNVEYDDKITMEWARIPHFYNAFYVYQYATGYAAAVAISHKILKEGAPARDAYLKFLGSGDSNYPIELLKEAGVDMSKPDVVESALDVFAELVDEMEQMV